MKTKWSYGAVLGAFIRNQIEGAAASSLGGDGAPDAEALQGAADAIREQIVDRTGMTLEHLLSIESGAQEPTDAEADGIAAVLSEHGVEVTGEDIRAMRESAEDETMADETETTEEEMRAETGEQAAERVAELEREVADLRRQAMKLRSDAKAAEPFVAAGRERLEERRKTLLRRVAIERSKSVDELPESYRKQIASASMETLAMLEETAGVDPLTTPMCAECGERVAAEYRSGADAVGDDGRPRETHRRNAEPTSDDIYSAAVAYQRSEREAGNEIPIHEATRTVARLSHSELFNLIDAASARV